VAAAGVVTYVDRSDEEQELAAMDAADGDPIPLTDKAAAPAFPVGSLPKPIADMVCAVAEATQTDPAMAGTSALSALSACTGGHAEIQIRQGWREPLNIYTATIADPGERKSAVQQSMVRPIHDVEEQLAKEGAGDVSSRVGPIRDFMRISGCLGVSQAFHRYSGEYSQSPYLPVASFDSRCAISASRPSATC
jgi:hypothetical protein